MLKRTLLAAVFCALSSGAMLASSICPSTPTTTTDCDFVITIASSGTASVAKVPGSWPFITAMTLVDGTMVPGGNGSLVGVVNDYAKPLATLTIEGAGANTGIFDFDFNGICIYTKAAYCATAATGYEGPTTTFGNLKPGTNPFETAIATVMFHPGLAMGADTYFALEGSAADIEANGGLKVLGETFGSTTATPEPAALALLGLGGSLLYLLRWRRPN